MRMKLGFSVAGISLVVVLLAAVPVLAHHAFGLQYDPSKSTKLHGVVTKVEWTNPHAHFYLDVRDENGNVINWHMELASTNSLRLLGWTRDIIKVGDEDSVFGAPDKDGAEMAKARTVTLADG